MAIRIKSDPMKVFGFVLIVTFSVVVLAVIGVSARKFTANRVKAYTCSYVSDPEWKVQATGIVKVLNPELGSDNMDKKFDWQPEKSVIRTVLAGCNSGSVAFVRRGYRGEEPGDTPMNYEDLKVLHNVEVIGQSETRSKASRIVPTIVRDLSLYGTTFKGKVERMLFTADQGGDVIGFVMIDVVRKGNGKPLGNAVSLLYSNKVGCRRLGETNYAVTNCAGIRVGHMIEVAGVYDATNKSFIDPFAPLPVDGSKFWTKIYDMSLQPDSNAKIWSTDDVSFTADNFFMTIDGKTYIGDSSTRATSDPADPKRPDYTTLLVSWNEKGDDIKVKFAFKKDATHWWVSRLQTLKDGQWTDYQIIQSIGPSDQPAIQAAKDTEFTSSVLDIDSIVSERSKGKIHFDGLKLKAFLSWITRAPTPTPTPTLTPTPTPVLLPDLTITGVGEIVKWDNADKAVKATFTIKNIGKVKTLAPFEFTEKSGGTAQQQPSSTCKLSPLTELDPGESCDVVHVFVYQTTGTKVLQLTVDPQNTISEIFETNNIRSKNFTVTN